MCVMALDSNYKRTKLPKLILVDNSLHVTGAFKSALAIVDALRDTYDIEFVLSTQSALKTIVEERGVICHQLPMVELGRSWSKILRYVPQLLINTFCLRRLLSQCNTDILLINDYYNLLGAAVRLIGWRGRLLTMVRLLPYNQQRILNRVWSYLAIRYSDKVIAVSNAVRQQLPGNERVRVIYDPSSMDEKYQENFGSRNDDLIQCLYLANYISGKGHICALDAFVRAYQMNHKLRLRFVGGDMGLEKNRNLKHSLHRQALSFGLEDVVTFLGFTSDIEKEIKASDIVLNFSESESFSFTCLEAGIFGRPIIATRCGGPEEIIEEGISGALVPVGDVNAMAEAIIRLSLNESLRQLMGEAGHRIVRGRFSGEIYLSAFKKLQL